MEAGGGGGPGQAKGPPLPSPSYSPGLDQVAIAAGRRRVRLTVGHTAQSQDFYWPWNGLSTFSLQSGQPKFGDDSNQSRYACVWLDRAQKCPLPETGLPLSSPS